MDAAKLPGRPCHPALRLRRTVSPDEHSEDEMTEAIHVNVRFQAKPGKQNELARRMVELRPDVEALGGTSIVTVDSNDETESVTYHQLFLYLRQLRNAIASHRLGEQRMPRPFANGMNK